MTADLIRRIEAYQRGESSEITRILTDCVAALQSPAEGDVWALVERYAAARVDCAANPTHESAKAYARLAESDLRDALVAVQPQPQPKAAEGDTVAQALEKVRPLGYRFDAPGITKISQHPHGGAWVKLYSAEQLSSALAANVQPKAAAAHGGLIATLRALGRDDVLNRLVERKSLSFDERESIEALQAAAMKAAAALESQAQPKHTAEPVAWMHPSGGVLQSLRTGLERSTYTIPLYAQSPAPVAETMPSAWLITGGRLYKDQVVLLEGTADERIATRSDGSQKVPLFKAPAVGAGYFPNLEPVIKWLEGGCDVGEAVKELRIYQAKMQEQQL